METLPLNENDRNRLQQQCKEARKASLLFIGGAILLPFFIGFLLFITPIEFESTALYLTGGLVFLFALPFFFLFFDAYRKSKRAEFWLQQNCKHRITDIISAKDAYEIIVASTKIKFWENGNKLSVGMEVTVEYLPKESNLGGIIGVLRINEEPNPYFENAMVIGSPSI